MFGSDRKSCARCSARFLTAALELLYAGFAPPGGFVIPCFEPVNTTDLGVLDLDDRTKGRSTSSPFRGPKRFVDRV